MAGSGPFVRWLGEVMVFDLPKANVGGRGLFLKILSPPGKGAEDERTAEWALSLCMATTGTDTKVTVTILAAPATLGPVDLMWTYSRAGSLKGVGHDCSSD